MDKIEEVKRRNASALQSILEMVGNLSRKCDTISKVIEDSKKRSSKQQFSRTLNANHPKYSVASEQEVLKNEIVEMSNSVTGGLEETAEDGEQTVLKQIETSERTSIECSQGNSDDKQSNLNTNKSHNSKTSITKVQKIATTVSIVTKENSVPQKQGTEVKQNLKIHRNKSGYKFCIVSKDKDNRYCKRKKKRCFQGELLQPVMESEDKPNLPAPNIVVKKDQTR